MDSNMILNNTTPKIDVISKADTAWILASTCLVFIMLPGIGFYYGGMISRKSILTMLFSTLLSKAIVTIQWFIMGFSLAFSTTGSDFIGNLDYIFLRNIGNEPYPLAPTIPGNTFVIFQLMFAVLSPCLAFGSAIERTSLSSFCIFIFLWSTFVYDIVAYWVWSPNGWLHHLGVLDFAGGTPVHVVSGFSALAYALAVGPRRTVDFKKVKPSNVSDVYIGTALLWFGWFGFNSGCELAINSRAVNALVVTNLAACSGGISWVIIEMLFHKTRKMSLFGFCSGSIAGLVAITPASGFVKPHFAVLIGGLTSIICFFITPIKRLTKYKYDDVCDVFAIHGMGGILGCMFTAIFADNDVVTMSGGEPIPGTRWQNYTLFGYHLLSIVVAAAWSFVFTYIILLIISFLPFVKLRLNEKEEEIGSDLIELGEVSYGHDIIEIEKEELQKIDAESKKENGFQILKKYFEKSNVVRDSSN